MPAKDWRSADRSGRHGPAARSVRAVVLRIQHTLSWACMAEAGLLFLAAAALTLALILRAGGELRSPGAWALAFISGACAGAVWLREHHQSGLQIARSLDARMRHRGSLVTAYEMETQSQISALGGLLVRRVLERLRLSEALRAMFPSLVIPIAAPLLSLGLLGLSLDAQREEAQRSADLGGLTEGLVDALIGLDQASVQAGEVGEIKSDTLREMLALSDRAKSIQRRSGSLSVDPELALAELGALAQDVADMAARVQGKPELSAPLERAGIWMDAARMELLAAQERSSADLSPKAGPGGAQSVTSGQEKGMMSSGGSPGSPQGAGSASGGPDQGATPAPTPFSTQPNSGALAGEHWPPEYDGVISGWIELRGRATENDNR